MIPSRFMKQGEIWLITLDPTVGAEIKKTRPAIIVNNNRIGKLPLKIIVPITDWQNRYNDVQWMVKLLPDFSTFKNQIIIQHILDDCTNCLLCNPFRFTIFNFLFMN